MHFSSIQVLLLAVVAITSTPRSALGQAAPKNCTATDVNKQFCSSCSQTSKCETAGQAPVPKTKCASGQACTVLLGKYAVCKPVAETPCACGVKPAKCDTYNPDNTFICLNGGITVSKECRTEDVSDGTCIDGECGTEPPEATTISLDELCPEGETGFIAVTPVCTAAAYCDNGESVGIVDSCGAMQYYDVDELECLPAPPLPCPVASGSGAFPDKGNCSKWYICDVGTVLAEETCEGDTPEFDTVKSECVAKGAGTCSKNNGCNFDLITTSIFSSSTTTSSSTRTSTTTPTTTSTTTSTRTTNTPPPITSTTTSTRTITTTPTTTSTTSTKTTTAPSTTSSTSSSLSSTTSTSSSTIRPATCSAANVGIRYPLAGNCKKYQSCRLVSTNVYAYVEASCLGSLVFNAKTGYCDTLTNVPGCVPPS